MSSRGPVAHTGLAIVVPNGLAGGGARVEAVLWVRGSVTMAKRSVLIRRKV